MSDVETVDILAIGCGPFNIGLAALASTLDDIDIVVLDSAEEFRWHPGLMFEEAKLQVSFLSDLVSLVDPTHPLSFLAYLADVDRLYPFLVRQDFFPTRREYEAYLLWAIDRLPTLRFRTRVDAVAWDEDRRLFEVSATTADGATAILHAGHVVMGIGTEPAVPQALSTDSPKLVHSSEYLYHQDAAHAAGAVTVVGSGQSGAEIVIDLLEANLRGGPEVRWWTRTPWFAPLDFTKLSLEMTTPAYMNYFHGLSETTRDRIRPDHWQFHKGISSETLDRLHDLLYRRELREKTQPVQLRNGVEVEGIDELGDGRLRIRGRHRDTGSPLSHIADLVIAATGYRPRKPDFLAPITDRLHHDSQGRPIIESNHAVAADGDLAGRLFVANAEAHSHGVSAPNLDIGAVRNAKILNTVLGREAYRLQRHTAFTSFGVSEGDLSS